MGDRALCGDEDDLASGGNLRASCVRDSTQNASTESYSYLRTALIGSFLSVFLCSFLLIMAVMAELDLWLMTTVAVVFGTGMGTFLSGWIIPRAQREERKRLEAYCEHLESFQLNPRNHPLESLRVDSECIAGRISHEVHRVITEAYGGYHEGKQLRKTLLTTIERETRKAKSRLDHIAYLDGLTGLANRRSFDETAPEVMADMRMLAKDVICLTVDIDYFKNVNDSIGHDCGDDVLRFLADSIRSITRESDRAYRLGGDEFVILLTDITLKQAAEVAHRLQRLFSQMPWNYENIMKPSLSIGGASMDHTSVASLDELLKYSDQAMYGAKRAGKGCESILGLTADRAA